MRRHIADLSIVIAAALSIQASQAATDTWDPPAVRAYLDSVAASVQGGEPVTMWSPDDKALWLASQSPVEPALWRIDLPSGEEQLLLTAEALNKLLSDSLGNQLDDATDKTPDAEAGGPQGKPPLTLHLDGDVASAQALVNGSLFTIALESEATERGKSTKRSGKAELIGPASLLQAQSVRDMSPIAGWDQRELLSPDGRWFATLPGPNIGFREVGSAEVVAVTDSGSEDLQWFMGNDLWEYAGSSWSPNSRQLLVRSHDMRAMSGIPVVDWLSVPNTVKDFRYWARAGQPMPLSRFYLLAPDGSEPVSIDVVNNADEQVFFVDWSADSRELYFIRYSRDLKRLELHVADATSGKSRLLLREAATDGWVKWPSGKTLEPLPSGQGFLWRAQRDEHFHLYHYDREGKLQGQLTQGAFSVRGVDAIDEENGWVYFSANSDADHPYDIHINRVALSGGRHEQLTSQRGLHRADFSPRRGYFTVSHSHVDRPPRTDLYRSDGTLLSTLSTASVSDARLAWPAPETFTVKAADGRTDVHGLVFKPHGFDPAMRYPVIERIYGGMQSLSTPYGFFGAGLGRPGSEYRSLIAYLNHLGFVVVTVDTPGTPGRGRSFHMRNHGSWPAGIIADHRAALTQVAASRPWMDLSRLGIEGNSWGGYMVLRALTEAPGFYRAGSASVPEVSPYHGAHWDEYLLGTARDNSPGFDAAVIDPARLGGELLLIAGTADANVPISNLMLLLDGLAEHGKAYDLVLFPGTDHAHGGRGDRYAYAVNRMGVFFRRHLGGAEPVSRDSTSP
ncbi:MAG: DPP IV N-terminal domain-containing protein [Pseudomonadota bacterium]